MPLPLPSADESEQDFVSRFMGNEENADLKAPNTYQSIHKKKKVNRKQKYQIYLKNIF
jgi:hypothetical protein